MGYHAVYVCEFLITSYCVKMSLLQNITSTCSDISLFRKHRFELKLKAIEGDLVLVKNKTSFRFFSFTSERMRTLVEVHRA